MWGVCQQSAKIGTVTKEGGRKKRFISVQQQNRSQLPPAASVFYQHLGVFPEDKTKKNKNMYTHLLWKKEPPEIPETPRTTNINRVRLKSSPQTPERTGVLWQAVCSCVREYSFPWSAFTTTAHPIGSKVLAMECVSFVCCSMHCASSKIFPRPKPFTPVQFVKVSFYSCPHTPTYKHTRAPTHSRSLDGSFKKFELH